MAYIRNKIGKGDSGYKIQIKEFGLNTSFQTFTKRKVEAKAILTQVNQRIVDVNNGLKQFGADWTKQEKLNWLRTGKEPERLQGEILTLFSAIEKYLRFKAGAGKAITTQESYEYHLLRAKKYFNDIPLIHVTAEMAQEYVFWLDKQIITTGKNRGQTLSSSSQKKHIEEIKRVFRWSARCVEKNINWEVFLDVTYPKKRLTKFDNLTKFDDFQTRRDELKKYGISEIEEGAFLDIIYNKYQLDEHLRYLKKTLWEDGSFRTRRLFVTLLFCSSTGARRSELCRVKKEDLDLDNQAVRIWMRKGSGERDLKPHRRELLDDVIPYLKVLLLQTPKDQQCIFCADDKHVSGDSWDQKLEHRKWDYLTDQLKKALRNSIYAYAAGFHVYRHTLASILLTEGYSQAEVKLTIGWCTDEMAARYQHITRQRRRSTLETIRQGVPEVEFDGLGCLSGVSDRGEHERD